MRFLEEFDKFYSAKKEKQAFYSKNINNNSNYILNNEETIENADFVRLKFK